MMIQQSYQSALVPYHLCPTYYHKLVAPINFNKSLFIIHVQKFKIDTPFTSTPTLSSNDFFINMAAPVSAPQKPLPTYHYDHADKTENISYILSPDLYPAEYPLDIDASFNQLPKLYAAEKSDVDISWSIMQKYPRKQCLSVLSSALDEAFTGSSYNTTSFCNYNLCIEQEYKYSDQIFLEESGMLQYMGMTVSLDSPEVASCSLTDTFEYVPLYERDRIILWIISPFDYLLPSRQLKDLNDQSIPEDVRNGIFYEDCDIIVNFKPEVSHKLLTIAKYFM